jgi:drug/metabolite transporter (DMT)-like permease
MAAAEARREAQGLSPLALAVCLGLVWIVWGTTYLAIRVAVRSLPPMLMAGVRFLIAGGLLAGYAFARGEARPTRRQLLHASILGFCFFFMGNGAVVVAETRITSGVAALLIATEPIFIVAFSGQRPAPLQLVGMALASLGVLLIVGVPASVGSAPWAAGIVLVGCLGWAAASLRVRTADLPRSPQLAAGLEMLAGSAALLFGGLLRGEQLHLASATPDALLAFAYLVVFGSLVAFSAYQALARTAPPALTATYAYVNPIVAVAAGILLLGEPATPTLALAAAAIVVGVVLITASPMLGRKRRQVAQEDVLRSS